MHIKKIFKGAALLGALGALSTSLVACGSQSTQSNQKVAFLVSTLNNPFFKTIDNALQQRLKDRGLDPKVNYQTFDSNNSTATEATNVEQIINLGIKVVIMNDVTFDSGVQATKKFNEAGVQVIHIDHPVDPVISRVQNKSDIKVVANIASDNVQAGQILAKYYRQVIGIPFSTNTFSAYGIPGTESSIQRAAGFNRPVSADGTTKPSASDKYTIKVFNEAHTNSGEKYPGVQAEDNRQKAQDLTTSAIGFFAATNKPSPTRLAFATNDESALGVIGALKSGGLKLAGGKKYDANTNDIYVVGVDHTNDSIVSVLEGEQSATVFQNTGILGMSGISIDIALSILGIGDQDEVGKALNQEQIKFDTTLNKKDDATGLDVYYLTSADAAKTVASPNTYNYWLNRYPNITNDIITREIVKEGDKELVKDTDGRTPILDDFDATKPNSASKLSPKALDNGPFLRINTQLFWRGQTPLTNAESAGNEGKYIGQYLEDSGQGLKVILDKNALPDNAILAERFGSDWKDLYVSHWSNQDNLNFPSPSSS